MFYGPSKEHNWYEFQCGPKGQWDPTAEEMIKIFNLPFSRARYRVDDAATARWLLREGAASPNF